MTVDYKNISKPKDNRVLSKIVLVLFSLYILFSTVEVYLSTGDITQLEKQTSELVKEDEVSTYLDYQYSDNGIEQEVSDAREVFNVVQNVLYFGTMIAFVSWFYRTYANLRRREIEGVKYQDGVAIYVWVIPIVNLFRPVQMIGEIIDKLQERVHNSKSSYKKVNIKIGMRIWWTLFVLVNIGALILIQVSGSVDSIEMEVSALKTLQFLDILTILEAIGVIYIVYHINELERVLLER